MSNGTPLTVNRRLGAYAVGRRLPASEVGTILVKLLDAAYTYVATHPGVSLSDALVSVPVRPIAVAVSHADNTVRKYRNDLLTVFEAECAAAELGGLVDATRALRVHGGRRQLGIVTAIDLYESRPLVEFVSHLMHAAPSLTVADIRELVCLAFDFSPMEPPSPHTVYRLVKHHLGCRYKKLTRLPPRVLLPEHLERRAEVRKPSRRASHVLRRRSRMRP
jgi:hypothetical protein